MCMLMLDPPERIRMPTISPFDTSCACWCWIHQNESERQPFHHLTPHVHVDAGSTKMNQMLSNASCFSIWRLMCMLMLDPPEWIKCYQMLVFFNIWHLMCMLMLDPLERIRLGACTFLKRNEPGSLPSKFGSRNSPWSLGNFQLCRQGGGHVPQNCFLSACCLAACSSQVIWVGGCIDGVKLWQHWWIWWLAWQYIMSIYEHLWTFWVSMKCQWGCIRRLSKIYESTRCQAVWEIDAQALCFADASLKHNKAPKQVQPSYFPNKYTSIIYTLETIWTGEAADFGCFCTTLHKPISSVSWCS